MSWRLFLFAIPTLIVFALAQVFLYRRLVRDVTEHRWARKVAAVALPVLLVSGWVVGAISGRYRSDELRAVALVLLIWGGFLQYALLTTLCFEAGFWWHRRRGARVETAPFDPARRLFFQRAAALTTGVASTAIVAHGVSQAFSEPAVTELPVKIVDLPSALEGLTIVQLTDVHVGAIVQAQFLQQLVDVANRQKPDLVAITGDLVDGKVEHLAGYVATLNGLRSRYGTYFVTGNHDYYSGVDDWLAQLDRFGWVALRNRHVRVGDAGASFDLVGVDDWGTPRTGRRDYDLGRAVQGRRAGRASVLLSHQPVNEESVAASDIGLQLSGHTHGGQLFPGPLIAQAIWGERYAGLSRVGDTWFYTSRGCGFVGPPVRVMAPPEVVKVVLLRA